MKGISKVLSVLLILAAVFGFYGSTVTIKDVLSCKAYWEEEGKKSDENLDLLEDGVNQLKTNSAAYVQGVKDIADGEVTLASSKEQLAAGKVAYAEGEQQLAAGKQQAAEGEASLESLKALIAGITQLEEGIANYPETFQLATGIASQVGAYLAAEYPNSTKAAYINGFMKSNVGGDSTKPTYGEAAYSILNGFYPEEVEQGQPTKTEMLQYASDLSGEVGTTPEAIEGYLTKAAGVKLALSSIGTDGPAGLQKSLSDGLADLVSKVIASGNEEILAGIKQVLGADTYALFADKTKSPMIVDYTEPTKPEPRTLDSFYGTSKNGFGFTVIGGMGVLKNQLQLKYDAGLEELRAAKAKLEAGEQELAASAVKIADGEKQIAAGEVQLAEGKAKLAQFEEGEQTLIGGLKQLMATETYTGLKSIADRLGSAFNYLQANAKNVDLDKAASAVKTGREFSADSGAKITKELTNRAIGQGAILFAAVLALIAGVLGLMKKTKVAGILSVVALIASVVGVVVIKMAGTEMSAIAGSTIAGFGAIAGGVVLAAVALVAAIVLFGDKGVAAVEA